MSEALLTPEETEALLSALRDGGASEGPEARPTQLGAPDTPLRRSLRVADEAAPRLAASLRDVVLRMTSTGVEVRERPCEVVARDVAEGASIDPQGTWTIRRGFDEIGTVSLGASAGRFVLDRRLGTSEVLLATTRPENRPTSSLERRVLEPIMQAVIETLGSSALALGQLTLGTFRPLDSEDHRRFSPVLRCVLRVTLPVPLGQPILDEVCIVLHAPALLPRPAGPKGIAEGRRMIAQGLSAVDVDLVAVLGRASGSVRGLLALEVGQILRLDSSPERPVPVCVDDVAVMRGMPRVHGGNLAVEITDRPAEAREHGGAG